MEEQASSLFTPLKEIYQPYTYEFEVEQLANKEIVKEAESGEEDED